MAPPARLSGCHCRQHGPRSEREGTSPLPCHPRHLPLDGGWPRVEAARPSATRTCGRHEQRPPRTPSRCECADPSPSHRRLLRVCRLAPERPGRTASSVSGTVYRRQAAAGPPPPPVDQAGSVLRPRQGPEVVVPAEPRRPHHPLVRSRPVTKSQMCCHHGRAGCSTWGGVVVVGTSGVNPSSFGSTTT